jgi:hypothetical protein
MDVTLCFVLTDEGMEFMVELGMTVTGVGQFLEDELRFVDVAFSQASEEV